MKSFLLAPLLILSLALLVSCGSVQKFPLARFSHAESTGATKTKIESGFLRTVRLQPSEDLRANIVSQTPQLKDGIAPFIKPTLGVTESIDIDLYVGPRQGLQTALKIQFLGAPTSNAGAGNFSLGLRVGYSLYVGAEEINAGESFATPRLDRTLLVDSGYTMLEFLVGYRIIQPLLISIGYFKDSGKYNLKFKEGDRTTIGHELSATGPMLTTLFQKGFFLFQGTISQSSFEIPNRNIQYSTLTWGLSGGLIF